MDKPSRFTRNPGDILDWPRDSFSEDSLLALYQRIGYVAVMEACEDLRTSSERNYSFADRAAHAAVLSLVEEIEKENSGHAYPSEFLCRSHITCPGYPRRRPLGGEGS